MNEKQTTENVQEDSLEKVWEYQQYIGETQREKKKKWKNEIGAMWYFIIIMIAAFFVYHFIGQQVEVNGNSMQPTLQNGDRLILEKVSYYFTEPKRFDIIVFRPYIEQKSLYYIKRIIGLPGETVQIIGNTILINGKPLEEHYGREAMLDAGNARKKIKLASDEYFVLGDNRNDSTDSRFQIGNIKRSAILGRTFFRIWPWNQIELLKHQS